MMNERKSQRLFRFAVNLFCTTLQKITKRDFVYHCNKADIKAWEFFINVFGDRVGENFIREYSDFGFQVWFNTTVRKDYGKLIHFNWIYGKKGVQRYNKVSTKARAHYVRKELKVRYKIRTGRSDNNIAVFNQLRECEERFKKEYHNTQRGLLWCVANTTLFFHKSPLCVTCLHKNDCKLTLERTMPKIYKMRGYGEE
jgi:hypothetical protein